MARRSMILKRGSVMNESQREGEIFQKGQFWSWKGVVARDSGDLEANVRLESPQNSAGVRMKDSSVIRSC